MKLISEGLEDKNLWETVGIGLPKYDTCAVAEEIEQAPVWVHFGAGNISRISIGGLADRLIESGESSKGITCVETFDFSMIDQIYKPHDNLVLTVTLRADDSTDKKTIGSPTETLKAQSGVKEEWDRLKEIFTNPVLQTISFTIMEKGCVLKGSDGTYFPFIQADINNDLDKAVSTMAVMCALLYKRYKACKAPLAMVSMDNCSYNGEKLQSSILTTAKEWNRKGYVENGLITYPPDENQVSFPWFMIDKITSRPADSVCAELEKTGVEDMVPVIASKKTCIAPLINAEGPQYLVIEDKLPNGRPALEKAGVYITDRDTVNKVGRTKVTTCLNPLHTALAVYGCVLGCTLIADEIKDEQLSRLVHEISPVEGMPIVTDPGTLSSEGFANEVINVRISNPFMPDTPQRIATDTSQKVGIRYDETIKAYVEKYGDAKKLKAIPLALAGWCRYLLAVDDEGNAFELSTNPMVPELIAALKGVQVGVPESCTGQLKPILPNTNIFGTGLYEAGIGETVEVMFQEEITDPGAVRATLKKYVGQFQIPQGNIIDIHHREISPRGLPLEP